MAFSSARTLVAEALEREGRYEEAVAFAQAEIADEFVHNAPAQIRAGRVLARCHTALGQHALSASVLDAALELAQVGQYAMQEALTVRGRAVAGMAAGGGSGAGTAGHWSEATGRQRLSEALGRMHGGGAGALEAALAL